MSAMDQAVSTLAEFATGAIALRRPLPRPLPGWNSFTEFCHAQISSSNQTRRFFEMYVERGNFPVRSIRHNVERDTGTISSTCSSTSIRRGIP
jgi:hypothetical protein